MLKEIMIHLDHAPSCQSRLEVAINLAKQHGARLTGLYIYWSPRLQLSDHQLAEIREMFHQKTAGTGVAINWLGVDLGFSQSDVAEMVGYYASFTDLLIVGQPRIADKGQQNAFITSPERLLVGTSCPVLIVPDSDPRLHIGERIMVAWKAGPKASRSMHDAMPLLQTAKHVSVISVGKETFSPEESDLLSGYLAEHGVPANVELIPPGDLAVGDTFLNLAADDDIDLMVLGVHITARRGQLNMGDVGSYLLSQMTVPLLLSN